MDSWLSEMWYKLNFGLCYTGYTVSWGLKCAGSYNMPKSGPVLVIANHESFLDPVAIGIAVRRRLNYLARKTLFNNKVFGAYLRSVGCVPVDQDGVAKEGLKTSISVLQSGKPLLVFPEGERSWVGQLQPFKPGILLILRKAPVPILPVGVAGAYEAYPRGAGLPGFSPLFWPPNGKNLAVSVGKLIKPEEYSHLQREKLLDHLFHAVSAEVAKAEKLRLKP